MASVMSRSSSACSASGKSPRSVSAISAPISSPRSLALFPCSLASMARIAAGAFAAPRRKEEWISVGSPMRWMGGAIVLGRQQPVLLAAGGDPHLAGDRDRHVLSDRVAVDAGAALGDQPAGLVLGGDQPEADQRLDEAGASGDLERRQCLAGATFLERL